MRIEAGISRSKLKHNIDYIRKKTGDRKIMAVLKANAYGHGDCLMAGLLQDLGVNDFGVASLEEALRLRQAYPKASIYIIGALLPEDYLKAIEADVAITIHNKEGLEQAMKLPGGKWHLKIDTGMHRLGFSPQEIQTYLPLIKAIPFCGIATHFATADEVDKSFTLEQKKVFDEVYACLKEEGVGFEQVHFANSGASLYHDLTGSTMVRVGLALYGIDPAGLDDYLQPILSLRSRVMALRTIKAGESVGYGRLFVAKTTKTIATVAIGYADGYFRSLSNKGKVWINGQTCPVVGSVTMDHIMVDVTEKKVQVGDTVEIIGRHRQAKDITDKAQTIVYELLTGLPERVVRRIED